MTAPTEQHETLADNLNQILYDKVAGAQTVEVLSTHNDKVLQIVETPQGERFVTRSYIREAVDEIEHNYNTGFRRAWGEMHRAFGQVGIDIVPSRLIETDGEYPFVIVSEYVQDGKPLSEAPVEVKQNVIGGLGKLLAGDGNYIPAPEMVRDDMFLVVEREGEPKALLIDVDPLMAWAARIQGNDHTSAFYINKLAELAWDKWCVPEDRVPVISVLVRELGDFALEKFDFDSSATRAFMDVHFMSNGVDNRNTWSN